MVRLIMMILLASCAFVSVFPGGMAANADGQSVPLDAMAVLDFADDVTKDASVGMAFADLVESRLLERGCVLLERRKIRLLSGERVLGKVGIVSAESLDVGRKFPSIRRLVKGALRTEGEGGVVLELSMVDVVLGKPIATVSTTSGKIEEMCGKIDEAVGKLLSNFKGQEKHSQAQSGRKSIRAWIGDSPEASLWFYSGLHHWAAGEVEHAVFYFRKAWSHDQKFLLARCWERKCYDALGMDFAAKKIDEELKGMYGNPDVAAMAAEARKRSQYVLDEPATPLLQPDALRGFKEALAEDRRFSFFSISWISDFVREKDLRLSSDFDDYNGPKQWLMIDTAVVFIPGEDGRHVEAVALRDAFSGETIASVEAPKGFSGSPAQCAELARRLAVSKAKTSERARAAKPSDGIPPDPYGSGQTAHLPRRDDQPVERLAKALKLCRLYPKNPFYLHLVRRHTPGYRNQAFVEKGIEVIKSNPEFPYAAWYLSSLIFNSSPIVWGKCKTLSIRERYRVLLELFPDSVPALLVRYGICHEGVGGGSFEDDIRELVDIESKLAAHIKKYQKYTIEDYVKFKAVCEKNRGGTPMAGNDLELYKSFMSKSEEENKKPCWSICNPRLREVYFNILFLVAWRYARNGDGKSSLVYVEKAVAQQEELRIRNVQRILTMSCPIYDVGDSETELMIQPRMDVKFPADYPMTKDGGLDLDRLRRMAEDRDASSARPTKVASTANELFKQASLASGEAAVELHLQSFSRFISDEYDPKGDERFFPVHVLTQAEWLYRHLGDKACLKEPVDAFIAKIPRARHGVEICFSVCRFEDAERFLRQLEVSKEPMDRLYATEKKLELCHFFKTPKEVSSLLFEERKRIAKELVVEPGSLERSYVDLLFSMSTYFISHGMADEALDALRPMLEYKGQLSDSGRMRCSVEPNDGLRRYVYVGFPCMRSAEVLGGIAESQRSRFFEASELFRASLSRTGMGGTHTKGMNGEKAKKYIELLSAFSQTPDLFSIKGRLADSIVGEMRPVPLDIYTLFRSVARARRDSSFSMSKEERDFWIAETSSELRAKGQAVWPYFLKFICVKPYFIDNSHDDYFLEYQFELMPRELAASVPLFAYYWDTMPGDMLRAARYLGGLNMPKERSLPWLIASLSTGDHRTSPSELKRIVDLFGKPESGETIRVLSSMLDSPNVLARKLCAHALSKTVKIDLPMDKSGLPTDEAVSTIAERRVGGVFK